MDHKYPNIVRAVSETPWAILPSTLEAIKHFVALRAHGEKLNEEEIQARIGAGPAHKQPSQQGVVAVLPIYGVITPKADLMSDISGGTSVQTFAADFRSVLADDAVKAIVLDVDSPGGQTDLISEMASEIRAARGTKPIVAVANTMAASAAYWLATQADELVVTPSGSVGSVGVFAAHEDISGLNDKLGVKTTLISAGKDKTLGNPFEPLSEEATQMIQDRVNEAYDMFTGDVAKGRGVSTTQVKDGFGQGRMVSAQNAVKEGMADRVGTLEQTLARVANPNGRSRVGATAMVAAQSGAPPDNTELNDIDQAAASGLSFADEADELLRSLDAVVTRTETLRVLTGAKKEQLSALVERAQSVLDWHDPTKTISDGDALDVALTLARFRNQ
jgi:signal peptide peptidase SppA